jgi:hypothetical protein
MGLFRVNLNPAPITMQNRGSDMTHDQLERCPKGSTSSPLLPVVATVRVEVPEPPATEAGLNEHAGGVIVAGEPLRVILLQARVTFPPNPPAGTIEIMEVADPPAITDAGDKIVVEIRKPDGACTTSDRGAPWVSEPEAPVTVRG